MKEQEKQKIQQAQERNRRQPDKFEEELVAEIRSDFETRAGERRQIEAQWQLNSNFVIGNQYCYISPGLEVEDSEKFYFWQEKEAYNHIAAIVETRLAKLGKVRPKVSIRPASGDDSDIKTSKVATKIIDSAFNKLKLDTLINKATMWSEITGSVFYKVSWDPELGRNVGGGKNGRPIFEGDVRVDVCPSYEIFPSSLTCQSIEDCSSIIHAKAMHIDDIKRIWGEDVQKEETDIINMTSASLVGGLGMASTVPKVSRSKKDGHAVVIERYTRPTADKPDGELAIAAGSRLLYTGPLPYVNGNDGKRDLPFIKQDSLVHAGSFFGTSMVERAIPIQRSYNAVKNRKHEFLNRIAMGVLAVEDGSVDTVNLEEEGLSPGKILVYRQGSAPPQLMDPGRVPMDFAYEEDRLLSEFISVSGVSEIMRSSQVPSSLSSGTALQLLLDQDDTRLSTTAERVRDAVRLLGQQILRLYKQFASHQRLSKFVGGEGDIEIISWNNSDIGSDDVVLDTENELNTSKAARQNMIFELLRSGLLSDENGKISDVMRYKILDALGYGSWEVTRDIERLQSARAGKENLGAAISEIAVSEIDEHATHIAEHTKYMLQSDFEAVRAKHPEITERLMAHIREHKRFRSLESEVERGSE